MPHLYATCRTARSRKNILSFLSAFTILPVVAAVAFSAMARAGEPEVVSEFGMTAAVESAYGFSIVPSSQMPERIYTEDLAPVQVLELARPEMRGVTVGRIMASCACIKVSMAKRTFADGEPALIEVRNVKPTVKDGATYMFFVQLLAPLEETLVGYVHVKSDPDLLKGTSKNLDF